jgi:hypothetical protein
MYPLGPPSTCIRWVLHPHNVSVGSSIHNVPTTGPEAKAAWMKEHPGQDPDQDPDDNHQEFVQKSLRGNN